MTSFLDLSTSITLHDLEFQKEGFWWFFLRFWLAAHILRLNCIEMAGDKPKQPVYEMFGIKLWFQQSKSRLPRLKEACECASQRWLGKGKGAMPQLGCRQGAHLPYLGLWAHHRLNGSSSPVLTATSLSYGKVKNSTPHRIKTPDLTEIKFGTVDYVGEMTPHAKFHVNPSKGGFPANGWNIRKNFYSYIPFFQKLT